MIFVAASEAATGLALLIVPSLVGQLFLVGLMMPASEPWKPIEFGYVLAMWVVPPTTIDSLCSPAGGSIEVAAEHRSQRAFGLCPGLDCERD